MPDTRKVDTLGATAWGASLRCTRTQVAPTRDEAGPSHGHSLRQLEDFMDTFNVDDPVANARQTLRSAPARSGRPVQRGEGPSPGVEGSGLEKAERELVSRRAAKESAQKSMEFIRRQKVDQWTALAERNNRKLRRENEALARIAELTQANALDNDARYTEALAALKGQVEYAGLFRGDSSETMAFVRDAISNIQTRVAEMRGSAEALKERELGNIRAAFERQVELKAGELEQVRLSGQHTTDDWIQQNKGLHDELVQLRESTETAFERHEQLLQRHQRLVVENEVLADDAKLLSRQWQVVSAGHRQHRDKVHELEMALAETSTRGRGSATPDGTARHGGGEDTALFDPATAQQQPAENAAAFDARLQAVVARAEAVLQREAANLQQVRQAHVTALKQRTELEVYLRQAVLRQQSRLSDLQSAARAAATTAGQNPPGTAAQSTVSAQVRGAAAALQRQEHGDGTAGADAGSGVALTSFTSDDRRAVIEALLSVPRVLQLLYPAPLPAPLPAPEPKHGKAPEEPPAVGEEAGKDLFNLGLRLPDPAPTADPAPEPQPEGFAAKLRGKAPVRADELHALWDRWRLWSTSADRALGGEVGYTLPDGGAAFADLARRGSTEP